MTSMRVTGKESTLLDLLDRLLDKGVVVAGDLTLGVADVDLIFASLRLVVTSVDKAWESKVPASYQGGPKDPLGDGGGSLPPAVGPLHSVAASEPDLPRPLLPSARREHGNAQSLAAPVQSSEESAKVKDMAFDPEKAANGLAQLVMTIAELLRKLLEREALRRMDRGTLTDLEIERLGQAFLRLEWMIGEIKKVFNLKDEDLNLDLGPLGKLM